MRSDISGLQVVGERAYTLGSPWANAPKWLLTRLIVYIAVAGVSAILFIGGVGILSFLRHPAQSPAHLSRTYDIPPEPHDPHIERDLLSFYPGTG
jgi:hypothetical protein